MRKAIIAFFVLLFVVVGAIFLYVGLQYVAGRVPNSARPAVTPSPAPQNDTPSVDKPFESRLDPKRPYRVVRVSDGDTIVVETDGKNVRVRLMGVRAPEKPGGRLAPQCYGEEAWLYLQKFLGGKTVRLEEDSIGDKTDQYKRPLRYVYADGRLVNAELIRDGYAYVYGRFRFEKKVEFRAHEKKAKAEKRGLWNPKNCPAK